MIRVLVVDDDFMVARIHRGFVERVDGFEVVGTAQHRRRGARARRARCSPTSCCSTSTCPTCSGSTSSRSCGPRGETCDVLVITAAKEADAVRGAVRQGVVGYLLKPFAFADLEQRLLTYAAERARGLGDDLTQAEIDAAFTSQPVGRAARRGSLPKGLSVETAEAVERALRESRRDAVGDGMR